MNTLKLVLRFSFVSWVVLLNAHGVLAQGLDGVVRGRVRDKSSGAAIPGATLTAKSDETNTVRNIHSNTEGIYVFTHLTSGNYSITAELKGFKKLARPSINVYANRTVELDFNLDPGEATAVVEDDAGEPQVQATTPELSKTVSGRPISDLPNFGRLGDATPYALSLLSPGTTTQPAGILGVGGSIGGGRPTHNSFTIDGVDNNRLDTTGPAAPLIAEAVQEVNLQTNQFSSEYGHSTAGQFNVITKSGTNQLHGEAFVFGNNRKLNAFDSQEKQDLQDGLISEKRRYDYLRTGGTIGGPIFKDRLFGFAAYQYQSLGREAAAYDGQTITNEGLETIKNDIRGLNTNNLNIIKNQSIWPTALVPNGNFASVTGSDGVVSQVELGSLVGSSPSFMTQRDWLTNIDYLGESQQIHGHIFFSNNRQPNINENFAYPLYTADNSLDQWLLNLSQIQPIKPTFVRETRVQMRRFDFVSNIPGTFTSTPDYSISSWGLFMGPGTESPQSRKETVYQFVNDFSWLKGRHTIKFGAEYRRWVAPTDSLPNSRGSYDWNSLQSFLMDDIPTGANAATRGVGTTTFDDTRNGFYGFIQDDFKLRPTLTLNLGVRYEYMGNPRDASLQALNEVASIPGVFDFREPHTDRKNFGPRLGFAYDLSGNGTTVIRGGVGISYDVMFGDLTRLSLPPQYQQVLTPTLACLELDTVPNYCRNNTPVGPPNARGFLTSGGLPSISIPPQTVLESRAATTGYIPDTMSPVVYTWSLDVQHEFRREWLFEVTYVGTRGIHLPTANNRNPGMPVPDGLSLPTYFNTSAVPANAAQAPSLADVLNYPGSGTRLLQGLGFTNDIIAYDPIGSSTYHAASFYVQRRPAKGLFIRGGYTWSHTIDDASTEISDSAINPVRAQDYFNLKNEKGNSALNRPHRFDFTWSYQLPKAGNPEGLSGKVLTGWQLNGIVLVESGQPVDLLSGQDVNNNLDATSDRVAINPSGDPNVGSGTNFVVRDPVTGATSITSINPGDPSRIVGYVATNPNAKWVATRIGGIADSGRNLMTTPGLNNWNVGLSRNVPVGENKTLQFRADVINALNHPQYSPIGDPKNAGLSIFQLLDTRYITSTDFVNPASPKFLVPSAFNAGGRMLELGVKFIF